MAKKGMPGKRVEPTTGHNGEFGFNCRTCNVHKPLSEFTKSKRLFHGYDTQCKECLKWRQKKTNYGITKQQYEAILHQQGGVCAVCKCLPSSDRCTHGHLVVDHCHGSGLVRGLLCSRCNATLGESMDNVATLEALISYIKQPPALSMEIKP